MAIQIPYTDGIATPPGVSNVELQSNKGQANGYAPLDQNAKVPSANLPVVDVSGQIDTHNSITTSVHGIANTADLIHSGTNVDKVVTFQSGTTNSEIGAWGFGVETQGKDAYITPNGVYVEKNINTGDTNHTAVVSIADNKITFSPCGGTIDLSGNPYNSQLNYNSNGGSINLSAWNGDSCNAGSLISSGGIGTSASGGTLDMSGGTDCGGGSITTKGGVANEEDSHPMGGSIDTSGGSKAGGSINTSDGGGYINTSNSGGYIDTTGGGYIKTAGSINTDDGFIELGRLDRQAKIISRSIDKTIETADCNGKMLVATTNGISSYDSAYSEYEFGPSVRGLNNEQRSNSGQMLILGGSGVHIYTTNISKFTLTFPTANSMAGDYYWVQQQKAYIQKTGLGDGYIQLRNGYFEVFGTQGGDVLFFGFIESPTGNLYRTADYSGALPVISVFTGDTSFQSFIIYPPSYYSAETHGLNLANGGTIDTSFGGGSIYTTGTGRIEFGEDGTRTTLNGSASGSNKTITLPNATGTVSLEGHTHTIANVTGLQTALEGKQASGSYAPATGISPTAITGTAVITTDSRLSNARTPTAHASTHAVGSGSDPITPSMIGASALGHGHAISDISNLQTNLNAIPKTYAVYSFAATSASTADQWQATITIPANTLGENGYITGHIWASCSASSSAKRIRAYITNVNPNNAIPTGAGTFTRFVNVTTSTSTIATTAVSIMRSFTIMNKNSVTSQIVQPSASGGLASTTSADAFEELAYDTTRPLYIVIGLQKDATGDTLQLKAFNLSTVYAL